MSIYGAQSQMTKLENDELMKLDRTVDILIE